MKNLHFVFLPDLYKNLKNITKTNDKLKYIIYSA